MDESNKFNLSNDKTNDTEHHVEKKPSSHKIPFYINGTFSSKMDVWVKRWIDYSSKYGIGYLLNNGYYGVYFNDNTKMLLNPVDERFIYLQRNISGTQEPLLQFFLKDYPYNLKTKVKLFIEFKKFLEEDIEDKNVKRKSVELSPSKKDKKKNEEEKEKEETKNIDVDFSSVEVKESDFIFVKKWVNTRHAIIFRFSNKLIQTIFKDKTQILIHPFTNCVTYINKTEDKYVFELNKIFESNNYEVIRRVKYVKEILAHMASVNKRKKENEKESKDKSKSDCENTKKGESENTINK